MKKFIKLVAFIVDMVFVPVRFVVGALTLVCGCIVHELNIIESLKSMVEMTIFDFKVGFKPTIKKVFED